MIKEIALLLLATASISCFAEGSGCLPSDAVADVENFSINFESGQASKVIALTEKMASIAAKAKKDNVALKDQLPTVDMDNFNRARHDAIAVQYRSRVFSDYVRDVQVLANLVGVAEIDDIWSGFDGKPKASDDPQQFYLAILTDLRAAQPEPPEGKAPDTKNGCTMAAALFLVEYFNMEQMAKQPTNKSVLSYILDIRRIESLQHVSAVLMTKSSSDSENIKWTGDQPNFDSSFQSWLANQPKSAQTIAQVVEPYIGSKMPSRASYEQKHTADHMQVIEKEFSPKK